VGEALRGQRQNHLLDTGQAPLPLLDDGRLERAGHIRGTATSTGPTSVSTVLARVPLRELPLPRPSASCLSYEVIGDLALRCGLQDPLGQLLRQPALPSQPQTLAAGPVHEHRNQLLITRRRALIVTAPEQPGLW